MSAKWILLQRIVNKSPRNLSIPAANITTNATTWLTELYTYNLEEAVVTLTNAQIKALRATPITIVAAPGSGKMVQLVGWVIINNWGTNALTESTANLALKFTDGSWVQVSQTVESTGFVDQTDATLTSIFPKIDAIATEAAATNAPLVIHNLWAGEFAGNAANDVTLTVKVLYRVISL